MLNKNNNKNNISTKLSLPSHFDKNDKKYYKDLHSRLPEMKKNQLSIQGVNMEVDSSRKIIVTVFISSTVEKPISLKPSNIILLDERLEVLASTQEDFIGFERLLPNTSRPWIIEFRKDDLNDWDKDRLKKWSVVFEDNLKHRLDLSDMDERKISKDSMDKLNKIIEEDPVEDNELKLVGLLAKFDKEKNLVVTLLIRNGTNKDLEIKQLPLKFYDGLGELSAEGTFKLRDLVVLGNTSKPISLVFPYSNIIKKDMELSKWSIVHNV